jgi:hypothetical protein
MQTEGLCQHIHCQFCDSKEKPLVVVTPGKIGQKRQTKCFCTSCWRFTDKHHGNNEVKDMSFFRHFNNPETGRFHRVLPYQEEEHPRRIRGPVTDAELDHFRQDRLQLRKEGGLDTYVNEIIRALTSEEMEVIRELADQALRDAKSTEVLTEDVLNCTIQLSTS